ncbi:MAG: 4Fe-4S binding protein [Bacillota bacterium]|jgi:ferredoxin
MTLYKIHFSPTGGTKKVIDCLGEHLQPENTDVDIFDSKKDLTALKFDRFDLCLVAVPSFGGRVPAAAAARIKELRGNGAKAIPIAVFGNRAFDDTLLELKALLKAAGFVCVAAVAANAEHSLMRQYGTGRPDKFDQKELAEFAEKINSALRHNKYTEDVEVPGNFPYREYNGVPFKPAGDHHCNKCGACVEQCPVGAISPTAPRETDKEKCISCMRCVAFCPQKARHVNEKLLAVAALQKKKIFAERKINSLFI